MKRTIFACILVALLLVLLPSLAQPADATSLTKVENLTMTGIKPELGLNFAELSATVSQNAILEGIYVYNSHTGELLTEGRFEQGRSYKIQYVMNAADGCYFWQSVSINFNNYRYVEYPEDEKQLVLEITLDTYQYFQDVDLSMPMLTPGMNPKDIPISVPSNAPYHVESFQIVDLEDESKEVESLQNGRKYQLRVTVAANEGYRTKHFVAARCNRAGMITTIASSKEWVECTKDFTLDITQIDISSLPTDIKEGKQIGTPGVYASSLQVEVVNRRWLDANMQPCVTTDKFQGNQVYWCAFDVVTIGPIGSLGTPVITTGNFESTVEIIDDTRATVYIRYTPLLQVGKIQLFTQGIALGKPINGVTANIIGNVKVTRIGITADSKSVSDGVFESGKHYYISFYMEPLEGYYLDNSTTSLELDGVEHEFTFIGHFTSISCSVFFNTHKQINTVKLTASGVSVGKSIAKAKLKPASGAKFNIFYLSWASTNPESSKFKKGELYQATFSLEADEGYCFTEKSVVTIDGNKAFNIELGFKGQFLYGVVEFSYRTKISKVSLPAMPKSVSLGATLPTNFKVSSSSKYTLTPVWVALSTQAQATSASQKDSYVLTYTVVPKKGYDFTEDTVFYVGGKKVTPMLAYSDGAEIMKVYNVGLTLIDRIDLTVAEPEKDAIPGIVTVAADAPYAPVTMGWGVNTSGKLDDSVQAAAVFENYKYHFLGAEFVAADGYAFADKVTVYINGNKFTVLEDYAFGPAYQMTVSFGKLGDIPKLTAPGLTKDGLTLSWGSVRNADAYEIYRTTSKSGKYTKVATVSETTWTDSPTAGKTYYYKVKAIFTPDTSKNSGYSKYVSIAYQCVAPEISATNDAKGKPYISWEKVSGAKKYTVYRATSETGKYKKLGTTKKLYYTDTKASAGTTYYYKIIANASSSKYNSPYSNIVSCDVICGTPSVTVKVNAATGKPSLSWKKITGAVSYDIYRDGQLLQSTTAVSYTDTTAEIGKTYTYTVQAIGKQPVYNSQLSGEKQVTATCAAPKPSGKVGENKKPVIAWGEVEGAVKYEIYRSTSKSKGYKVIGESETLTYEDLTAKKGKTYYYKVVAVGEGFESVQSSYVKIKSK